MAIMSGHDLHHSRPNPKGTKMTDKIDIDELIEAQHDICDRFFKEVSGHSELYSALIDHKQKTIAALTDMKSREDVIDYLKISDSDATLIRGLLDVTDIWDNHDKAIDRMLSCFPNDPLNKTNHKGDEL